MDDIRIRADLDSALGLSLFRYGLSEPTAAAIRANLKPGDTFIDGGANIGLMTLVGARAVGPTGQVLAVEPNDSLVRLLADNLDLNHVTWVQVIATALAEDDRETVLHVFDGDAAGSSSLSRLEGSVAQAVRTTTLDGLVDRADLVKLDLEGAEVRALNGATRLLCEIRPKFIVVRLRPTIFAGTVTRRPNSGTFSPTRATARTDSTVITSETGPSYTIRPARTCFRFRPEVSAKRDEVPH